MSTSLAPTHQISAPGEIPASWVRVVVFLALAALGLGVFALVWWDTSAPLVLLGVCLGAGLAFALVLKNADSASDQDYIRTVMGPEVALWPVSALHHSLTRKRALMYLDNVLSGEEETLEVAESLAENFMGTLTDLVDTSRRLTGI